MSCEPAFEESIAMPAEIDDESEDFKLSQRSVPFAFAIDESTRDSGYSSDSQSSFSDFDSSLDLSWQQLASSHAISSEHRFSSISIAPRQTNSTKVTAQKDTDATLAEDSFFTGLVADSNPCSLPVVHNARHRDLATISHCTLSQALSSGLSNITVVDCRYPYEFDGGHIKGAINLYTKDMIVESFMKGKEPRDSSALVQSRVIVFHCEFSSERGPKMMRFLRQLDRSMNEASYPALHYPEIYLLEGGYKTFWEQCSINTKVGHFEPVSYRPMLDKVYQDQLKHFRAKSKSWSGSSKVTSKRKMMRSKSMVAHKLF